MARWTVRSMMFAGALAGMAQVQDAAHQVRSLVLLRNTVEKSVSRLDAIHADLQKLIPELLKQSKKGDFSGTFARTGGPLAMAACINGDLLELRVGRTLLECYGRMSCDADRSVIETMFNKGIPGMIDAVSKTQSAAESRAASFRALDVSEGEKAVLDRTVKGGDDGIEEYRTLVKALTEAQATAKK